MQESKLTKNIIALVFVQFSNYIAPLLVLPYLSRVLGLEGFGIVAMAMSLCAIALIFTDYGFGLSAPYWLAKNKNDKKLVASYLSSIFTAKVLLFIIVVTCVYFYLNRNGNINYDLTFQVAIIITIFFQTFQTDWFFIGIEKMKNVTIIMVASKIIYLILVFLLINNATQISLLIICYAISNLIGSLIGFFFIYKEGYWLAKPTKQQVWRVFADSALFFVSRLSVGVYTSASTFVVGLFSGASAAALYSSAEKLYQAGQSATSPVTQALFPYLARTGNKHVLFKFIGLLFIPLALGITCCIYYSELIITTIFGLEFRPATDLLQIFLLTLLVTFIGVNFGYPAFASIGRIDIANKTVIFAAILQLIFIFSLYITDCVTAKNICLSIFIVEFIVMLCRVVLFTCLLHKNNKKYSFL